MNTGMLVDFFAPLAYAASPFGGDAQMYAIIFNFYVDSGAVK